MQRDNDELTPSQLQQIGVETALYSVHAAGLVFDPATKTLLIADPNAALIPRGSMEFVSLPIAKLRKNMKPTKVDVANFPPNTQRA